MKKLLSLTLVLALLLTTLLVAGALPVLAEGNTVPTMKLRGWGVEGGQNYNVRVSGLTIGEPYRMKILYKAHEGKAQFLYNDTVLMLGSEVQNGASYDAATSTLTYSFAAAADMAKFTLKLTDHSAWNSAFISSLLVEDKTGKNVYEVNPVYTDGVLTGFEGWGNGGWRGGITFEEKAIADFGADMSTWDTPEGEVVACEHEYDDEFDATCNRCGEVRLARVLGKVYGVIGKGWKNEDSQTIGVVTDALTEGATYTVSFLYKTIKGVPYVTISGLGDTIKLVENGEAVNGATFNKATGAYSYTFTAPAGKVGVRTTFNTATSGYSEFYMADVKFTDAEGNVVDESGFVQFDGWSDGWGGNFNGCTWTEFDNSVFACAHEYDGTRDADCNLCGAVREVANDLGLNKIELTWKGNGDDLGTYYYVDLPTEIGTEYTYTAVWQYLSGNVELKVDGNIVMENDKAAEGVIYADKVVAYTFTATKETTRIALKPTAKGNNYVVEMGEPMLYVDAGVVRLEPGTTWALGNSWNAWPNKVTPIDALSESVGINEIQLTWKSNGDSSGTMYELGLAASTGKTYTLKFKYLSLAGNFEIRLANASERITLMTGTTPAEGVTFEDDYLTYTFTANGPIALQLKAAVQGVSNKAQVGEITLTDDAGTVTDPTFGSAWTAYFTWNAWPLSVTPVEEFATALGNTELQLCWKSNGDDMGTFYYIDLPTVAGKTYNFSAKYIQLDGAGFELKLGGVVLMKGTDVVAEGVTYANGIVNYTFTATGATTRLALNCAAKGDKTTARIGEISAIETESGIAATTLGLKWAMANSWNGWPFYQKDIEEIGKRVGNVQINLCFKSAGTDGTGTSYGLTLQAVVGTEYTLKLKYLPISGPGFQMKLGSTVLMNGATPKAGVTYDPETYELTYTFTADTVAPILHLKSVNFGDNNTARIGEVRLVDGNGNELLPVPGSNWTLYTAYNAWPFSVTEVESIACLHAYDNDCDADCNVCGATREAAHTYDNRYDADCNYCGALREVPSTPYVMTSDYLVNPGDTFEVPIYVGNNPGIVSLAFRIGYDSSVLELVGKTNGDFDGDYSFGPNFQQNPYKINWMNPLITEDITTNGTFVTLTFKVKENARPGASTTFTYSYNQADIYNFDFEDVVFDFVGGTVTVDGGSGGDEEIEYTNPTIATDNYTVRPGETFDVPITVYNNPGIVSLAFKIGYDRSVLELVGKTNGDFDGDYSFSQNYTAYPYKINWMNALSTEDITTNGTFVTLRFKVKEDAAPGASTTFTYSYNQADICNYDFEDVVFDFVGGTVTVWPCDHSYSAVCDPTCNLCGATRPVTHTYTNVCDTNCNVCNAYRTVPHVWSNACDEICNVCYHTRTITHAYSNVCDQYCNVCNAYRTVPHVWSNVCDEICNVCYHTRTVPHAYDHGCDPDCNLCGKTRKVEHKYDNVCDAYCNVCNFSREVSHYYVGGTCPNCNGTCADPMGGAHVTTGDYIVKAGQTFQVTIDVGNNPGIISLPFKLGYDSSMVELVGKQNGAFEGDYTFSPDLTVNPYKINWTNALSPEDITTNGTFMTLTFKVKDTVAVGDSFHFEYVYTPFDICDFDFDEVDFTFIGGTVKVASPGDVNGDDKVNNRDVIALQRFLNEWDVEVVEAVCDVTGDGRITNRDSIVLQRYLDEWDVTLY